MHSSVRKTKESNPSSAVMLSVIIVSWNVWPLLRACLGSLAAQSRPCPPAQTPSPSGEVRLFGPPGVEPALASPLTCEVIVVDNASSDATRHQLPQEFPWVRLICNPSNWGFTRANNIGYGHSSGEFIYFLNPDTELVAADSLWQLYVALAADPTLGMAGPQLRYGDGSWQNNRRRFPTRLSGFFESTWLAQTWPRNPWAQRMYMADIAADQTHEVDWLTGAAMLVRRTALEAVSRSGQQPFDEGFFMYSEEVDLCKRLKEADWRIAYIPQAQVIHHEGKSSEQASAARAIHFNTSKVRYWRKWFGGGWSALLRGYLLGEYALQIGVEGAKWVLGHKRSLRQVRIVAYRQVLGSGFRSKA